MKKGFTMIELIFVIVILGILAAVAIPKLAATRDDAKIAKAAQDLSTLYSDLSSSYTAQGQFGDMNKTSAGLLTQTGIADMTNLSNVFLNTNTAAGKGKIDFKTDSNDTCITLTLTYDGNLSASSTYGSTPICSTLVTIDSVKAMLDTNQTIGGKKVKF